MIQQNMMLLNMILQKPINLIKKIDNWILILIEENKNKIHLLNLKKILKLV